MRDERCTIEDLMVAVADKLWMGKRVEDVEEALGAMVASQVGGKRWFMASIVDTICEAIAANGSERLARSASSPSRVLDVNVCEMAKHREITLNLVYRPT